MCQPTAEDTELSELVQRARSGDLASYGRLVARCQAMAYAVCRRVLKERADALDAMQDAFLRAYQGLAQLAEPAAFPGYLRRIAIRCALDLRRRRRTTFAPLEAADEVAVLDDREHTWSAAQRQQLNRALLLLTPEERRITERFYHGAWSLARLARRAGVSDMAMRKRLERIRNKLRMEVEMDEQRRTRHESLPADLPERIVELLARPVLVDLPDNPVAKVVELVGAQFSDHQWVETPEWIDLTRARSRLACDPVYVPEDKLFQLTDGRILRYDLSLPLWLEAAGRGAPLRVMTAGKVYRNELESTQRLAVFHQFELLWLDEAARVQAWSLIGRILGVLDQLVPGAVQRVSPSEYPFCSRAWDIGVEVQGEYMELIGCGEYRPEVVQLLGGDPARHSAFGLGLGVERLAMLHFGVHDIRLLDTMRV